MSYIKTGIQGDSPSQFAWDVFNELIKRYSITLGSRSGSLYNIPGSSFGNRSLFSSKNKRGYLPKTITISGIPLFLSKDWYYKRTNGLSIYDNLKDFVSSLTSKRFMVKDDSPTGGDKYVLYEDASIPYSSTTLGKSVSAEISLSTTAEKCKELLETNYNIILSGAPGTGKTYMARQIAHAMVGSDDRIGFVQFHPSYDYTDFVEGLRPTPPSDSTIGFERKDGIFKEFCEKALESLVDYKDSIETDNPNVNSAVTKEVTQQYPYFVFIIDEINRGEISKVFGELFFSIDPGYRGTEGKVRTQYANMVTSRNAFDIALRSTDNGHFFVPENVYIIGTMNDIDRSVDTMDFAMRRRFLIKEIKAEDTQEAMLENIDIIKKINDSVTKIEPKVIAKMDALNGVIEGKSERKTRAKLGSAYALGASYFQKYYKYNDFDKLWTNHIEGILREYLRGTADPDNDLKLLKETYYNA